MTITTQQTVWCDEDECNRWVKYTASTKHAARHAARSNGWACHGADDYCPDHNTKPDPKTDE